MKQKILIPFLLLFTLFMAHGQDISLYQQFNGRYDFTFVGNTLNPSENNTTTTCTIFTTSSASLNLGPNDEVLHAYLYWAGSGTGDFNIKLNGLDVAAERNFPLQALNTDGLTRDYFSAFADVTAQVQATGNGTYTVSDLDLTAWATSNLYCSIKTNFGGWALFIVYENPALPLNQLNLYDGLQYVPDAINVVLPSLNVVDNEGAKLGFIAWEGDAGLAVSESLSINGNVLSNALNPATNAFNGTNSATGATNMYNMDLDIYDIQNFIAIGDETADIQLQSGQDFVMVNAIISKLNSQLPDATIAVTNIAKTCGSHSVTVNYTVSNVNSTDVLPSGTPIAFYINGNLAATSQTNIQLPIGGSVTGTIVITVPNNAPADFELLVVVDDNGNGIGEVTETDETNNTDMVNDTLWISPPIAAANMTECETSTGSNSAVYDFSGYTTSLQNEPTDVVTFYTTLQGSQTGNTATQITTPGSYTSVANPQTIYIRRVDANGCVTLGTFQLITDDCLFPDATVIINSITKQCGSRAITVSYNVNNFNSQDILPAGTPVAIFANSVFITSFTIPTDIAIGGTLAGTITVNVPTNVPLTFNLIFIADNNGAVGTVQETNETNNSFTLSVTLFANPVLQQPANLTACETDNGTNVGIFDFSAYTESLKNNPTDVVTFYTTSEGAQTDDDTVQITTPGNYTSTANPQTIYVRLQDANGCFTTGSFTLTSVDCLFPDGTVTIDDVAQSCDSRDITVTYTVSNLNSFDVLPAGTSVAIYADGILLTTTTTATAIAIGGSITATIDLTIPAITALNFNLVFVVDDNGTGTGSVVENNETNNSFTLPVSLWVSPILTQPADVTACETFNGSGIGIFNYSAYAESLKVNATDVVTFHTSQADADSGDNDITNPDAYSSATNNTIYVRLEDAHGCYDTASFKLVIIDCYFPDATVDIEEVFKQCNSRIIHVHYTVYNTGSTDVLPAGTPVSIYADGQFLDYTETLEDIAIGESESSYITLTIPVGIPLDFNLTFVVDDTGDGTGIIIESDETNNSDTELTNLPLSPVLQQPEDITACDSGFGATFDFSAYAESLKNYPSETVTFYTTQPMADQDLDRIYDITNYKTGENPKRIYVRLDNGTCFTTASFLLVTQKCPPIPYNYVTPNGDGLNDVFFVENLRNVFLNFKTTIYNRWGALVWTGDNSTADWDGVANERKVGESGTTVPAGTYYYVIELNDPDFPEPLVGWVYVTM